MPIRALAVALDDPAELTAFAVALASELGRAPATGPAGAVTVVAVGAVGAVGAPGPSSADGWLAVDPMAMGLAADAPEVVAVVSSAVGALPREVVAACPPAHPLASAARSCAIPIIELRSGGPARLIAQVRAGVEALERADAAERSAVGVGPHPEPWPDDPRLDPALLQGGDRRNVIDRYRWWREDAIVADLDQRRHPVHVAVENWRHDLNIGTVVRNANAFNVAGVHVVGERRWNRRGAMATDRYLSVRHHRTIDDLVAWTLEEGLPIVGIDNVPGARDLDAAPLPAPCVLLFGQEGPGLSAAALAASSEVVAIAQHGSTRSLNAGVASGIALHAWVRDHGEPAPTWPEAPSVP